MGRITRAAVRSGAVHQDLDSPLNATESPAPAPETPKGMLRDVTNQTVLTPAGAAVATPKHPKFELQLVQGQKTPKTPRFDPEVHKQPSAGAGVDADADAGVAVSEQQQIEKKEEDSFIEHIISRTPSRVTTTAVVPSAVRIEDSVELMDNLEDEIEKVKSELPVITNVVELESPGKKYAHAPNSSVKTTAALRKEKTPSPHTPSAAKVTNGFGATRGTTTSVKRKTPSAAERVKGQDATGLLVKAENQRPLTIRSAAKSASPEKAPNRSITRAKPAIPTSLHPTIKRQSTTTHRSPLKVASKAAAAKPITTTSARGMSSSNSPAKREQRQPPVATTTSKRKTSSGTLSTSKPGFMPIKSSKATTTATFTLPGEAIAAKLKAQREERQKREDDDAAAKRTFKARPVPASINNLKSATMPRENRASRARLSLITGANSVFNGAPAATTAGPPQLDLLKANNTSRLSIAKTRTTTERTRASATANSAVRRTTLNERIRGPSITKPASPSLSVDELKARAKKAREEAAERGRAASREWAERQLARKNKVAAADLAAKTAAVESITEVGGVEA